MDKAPKKNTKGKKSSVADSFKDISVPTSSLKETQETYQKNGYVRPKTTYTDQLSKEQIEEKLEDYTKVEDISKVPLGVHMRYFSNVGGKMLFRMGGQLKQNTGLPDYVMLSNGTAKPWSVQVKDTIFYRKMTINEIKSEYQKVIDKLVEKNKKLKEENKKLKEELESN